MKAKSTVLGPRCLDLPISAAIVMFIAAVCQPCLAEVSNSPKLFAPGTVSGPADDLSPAFTADGKAVYFTRANNAASTIMKSTLTDGRWSAPTIAVFSGQWSDFEPTMAPDGSFLVFASNRPIIEGQSVIDGTFNGKTYPGGGGNLWRVDRKGDGWEIPKHLSDTVNQGTAVFSPSIAADGSLYFMRAQETTGTFHLFRSQFRSGGYLTPQPVGVGDATTEEVDPAIAPDESYLIYTANHPAKHDQKRLYIAFRRASGWDTPQDLGDEVNEAGSNIEARLGADHRTLYFSTNTVPPVSFPRTRLQAEQNLREMILWANGKENIWYVSLAPWLDNRNKR
jgi:Tol biopolymer transport system component